MGEAVRPKKVRQSGIELIKILAIFFIVVCHSAQGGINYDGLFNKACYIDLSQAYTNTQYFLIQLLYHGGVIGNTIFITCSAWFLCKSKSFKPNKAIGMIVDVWVISIIFLLVFLCLGFSIDGETLKRCFFPTLYANNWFITCYILLYCVHQYLNKIITSSTKRELFYLALWLFIFYFVIDSFIEDALFLSNIIYFISIYLIVAYIRYYAIEFCDNLVANVGIFVVASGLLIGVNYYIGYLYTQNNGMAIDYVLCTSRNVNVLVFFIGISLVNIFQRIKFVSPKINYLSSLTLFIYLIHENILWRTLVRPHYFDFLYSHGLYPYLVCFILLFAIVVFTVSSGLSLLYKEKLQRWTALFADKATVVLLKILPDVK